MNIKVTKKLLRISLTIFSCVFCFNTVMAQPTYKFYENQKLTGYNTDRIVYQSNDPERSVMKFLDKDGTVHGYIYGSGDGANFGILDGDGDWSYRSAKDHSNIFYVNDIELMRIRASGNVGIGISNPKHKLDVCGNIRAKEILVEEGWCDYVFEPEYCLTTLEEEAEFIKLYGHLSNFESAKAMDGMINVNDIFKRQQVQIEENVLHLIELKAENAALQNQVNALEIEVSSLSETNKIFEQKFTALSEINKNLEERLAALEAKFR